jgi:hypothetical protein
MTAIASLLQELARRLYDGLARCSRATKEANGRMARQSAIKHGQIRLQE